MKLKPVILAIVSIFLLSACKSLRNISSTNNTGSSRNSTQNKNGQPRFIDGIAVTPGSMSDKKNTPEAAIKKNGPVTYTQTDFDLNNFDIEKADSLQLKYAIVLDATVEKLTNLGLLKDIEHWWGTQYCMGGSTENCIDCSAFSQVIMKDVYNIIIPRTAQEQYDSSNKIETSFLQEGDLVFFHTTGRDISHVGVYLTNNKFVHASTSNGVMVSDLNDTYWRPRYKGAGRVMK